MKKFILITALIGLFLTPAFSQINGHIKRDQLLGDLSGFRYPQPFIWSDSTGFKSPLIVDGFTTILLSPTITKRSSSTGKSLLGESFRNGHLMA